MLSIASDISYIDLNFCDTPNAIATGVYTSAEGVALVDPGPGSCIDTLLASLTAQGISIRDIESILLTHIHLDHAGASGALVRRNPNIKVYVHERGARHMVDPSKLISSAHQLWGVEGVARLWGEIVPVPQANLKVLTGGEHIRAASRALRVQYTPGHAQHHVSYFDDTTGIAWAGDAAGLRCTSKVFTLPPTPPPDIDLEAWRESIASIRAWQPEIVFITHFGPYRDVRAHLDDFEKGLREVAEMARRSLEGDALDEAKYARFKADVENYSRRAGATDDDMKTLERVGPREFHWRGLVRYWRKRSDLQKHT